MTNSESLKIITDNVIIAIDNLKLSQNYPNSALPYLYLATTGLMINFGSSYVDDVFNNLKRVKFIEDTYYDLELYFDTNNIDINFNIVYRDEGLHTLEMMIKFLLEIQSHSYNLDNSEKIVSEVIKALKTEEIVKTLYSLKTVSLNYEFTKALMIFNDVDITTYHFDSNNAITNLFRPLFKFNFIKELFNKQLIDGNYGDIYREFDEILGKDAFRSMMNEIDDIKRLLNKKQVNTYNIACAYLNVRNNFVQSYITKKFVTA